MRDQRKALAGVLAVVVALIGIGAVAVITAQDDDTPPKLAVGGAAGAGDSRAASTEMAMPADMRYSGVEYRVRGTLPKLDGKAPAYSMGRHASRADVAALAKNLGVSGSVAQEDEAWVVRDGETVLRVFDQPGAPWNLSIEYGPTGGGGSEDCAVSSDGQTRCVSPDGGGSSGSGSSGSSTGSAGATEPADKPQSEPVPPPPPPESGEGESEAIDCPMPECPPGQSCIQSCPTPGDGGGDGGKPAPPQRPADLPSQADAERAGRDVLTRLGLDLDGARVNVYDAFDAWDVNVSPRVGDLEVVGLYWSVAIGPKGKVVRANGFLADPEKIGDYPLAGTDVGLKRLKETSGGGVAMGAATDLDDGREPAVGAPQTLIAPAPECPPEADCIAPVPEPGPPPEPLVRTITGVRLGLLFSAGFDVDDDATLVPAYLFEFGDEPEPVGAGAAIDNSIPVPAVTEEYLAEPDPQPKGRPEPAPAEPVVDPGPAPAEPARGPEG